MQLTAFRILKYRNIEDSGLVKLADRLTCIVGKNQSGKTNLLIPFPYQSDLAM
jgi:AAA15 family ATPase/GTPase